MIKRFLAPYLQRTPKYLYAGVQGNFNFQDILMLKRVDSSMRQALLQKEASCVNTT